MVARVREAAEHRHALLTPGAQALTPTRRQRPRLLRQLPRLGAAVEGAGGADVAVEAALVDALRDRGETEQRQYQVEVPVGTELAPAAPAIGGDVVRLVGNPIARREPGEIAAGAIGHVPGQAVIGEIYQRIAESPQL